jgi:hypothetical protein
LPAASGADGSMGHEPNGRHIQPDGNCHNGSMAGSRRFLDPSQPQTLQGAVMLCYITAVFGLLTLFALGLLSLIPIGLAFGAYGIANEKKWGYWLAVALAALNVAGGLYLAATGAGISILNLLFDVVLAALLLHPHSREYQRVWFR